MRFSTIVFAQLYLLAATVADDGRKLKKIKIEEPSLSPSEACALSAFPSCRDPTEEEDGWNQVAFMGVDGTMFDGNTNLSPCASYGSPNPTSDFQISYDHLIHGPDGDNEILFITGNGRYWARTELNNALRTSRQIKTDQGTTPMDICKLGVESSVIGSVLMREGTLEDPWIGMADGGHFASAAQGLILWGEHAWCYYPEQLFLKEKNGGVKVYVRKIGCDSGGLTWMC
jgi:hypothetical protein